MNQAGAEGKVASSAATPRPSADGQPPTAGQAGDPPAGTSTMLELRGVRLGMTYAEVQTVAAKDGTLRGAWTDKQGGTGLVMVSPPGGERLPAQDFFFLDGQCVGYFHREQAREARFNQFAARLEEVMGPARPRPAWAAGDPFAANLPALDAPSQRQWWGDEHSGELLLLQWEAAPRRLLAALYRPAAMELLGIEYGPLMEVFEGPDTAKQGQ